MGKKRVWAHVVTGLTTVGLSGLLASACAHDDSTLFVVDVLAPQLVTAGQMCSFTNNPTQAVIPSGVLDTSLTLTYNPEYLVANQMVSQANPSQLQTETSYITIQGAIVRITDSLGNQIKTFTRLGVTTIAPASGTTPSFAPIGVTTIDEATAIANTPMSGSTVRLVTYVTFFGQTTGGDNIESNEFEFPVDLCAGCLVKISATDSNPCYMNQPNCVNGASNATTSTEPVPCVIGQDAPVDCSQCLNFAACNPNPGMPIHGTAACP
jgi:hypothetical protein